MRAWYPEKRNPQSRDRRFWDLGADLDKNGSLRIYRLPCGASKEGNKCLVLHQKDTVDNPEALEIIVEGDSPNTAIAVRKTEGGNVIGSVNMTSGDWVVPSSVTLKEDFKDVSFKFLEKVATKLSVKSWSYKDRPGTRHVGPTSEEFKEITGYGDGEAIPRNTWLGITFKMCQFLWKKVAEFDKRLKALEQK